MRLLGNTTEALPPFASIQRLFAEHWNAAHGLTGFDQAFSRRLSATTAGDTPADVVKAIAQAVARATPKDPPQPAAAVPSAAARLSTDQPGATLPGTAAPPAATEKQDRPVAPPAWRNGIVVTARRDGPVLWRVRKGGATLVRLGSVWPLPAKPQWSDRRTRVAIRRSRLVLVSAESDANLVMLRAWTPAAARGLHPPRGRRLWNDLDDRQGVRLAAASAVTGRNAENYDDLRPAATGMLLNADWRARAGLTNTGLAPQIFAIARAARVPVHVVRQTSLVTTIDEVLGLDMLTQRRAFNQLRGSVERARDRAADQARDWARGDLAALRRSYLSPTNCSSTIPNNAKIRDKAIGVWIDLLTRRLNKLVRSAAGGVAPIIAEGSSYWLAGRR